MAGAAMLGFVPEAAGAQTPTWTGQWDTTYGPMYLKQKGNKVTGTYNYDAEKSEIVATASGLSLDGIWDERPAECDTGKINWLMSPNGLSFSGTWGAGCGSGGSWEGTRTHIGSPLTVSVKTTGTPGTEKTEVEARVENVGDEPIDGVQVRGVSAKRIKTTCGKDPVKFKKSGLGGGGQTLAPSEALVATFAYEEVCAGSAKATVRAIAAEGVEVAGSTTVKVADNAYITGRLELVHAGYGRPMTEEDRARLFKDLRVRAVGKKRTLDVRPDAPLFNTYKIKVPNNALGQYEISVAGNKVAEADPASTTATAARGKTAYAKRTLRIGYDCDVPPRGMTFVPETGWYYSPLVPSGNRVGVRYACRIQRVLVQAVSLRPPDLTVLPGPTCVRGDGSTYELMTTYVETEPGPVVDAKAATTEPLTDGQFALTIQTIIKDDADPAGRLGIPAQVTGSFSGRNRGTIRISHPECGWLNREGEILDPSGGGR